MTDTALLHELEEAERKAWQSLARYKFQMFGYWAAIWVHLNRVGQFKRANPFKRLVKASRRSTFGVEFLTWAKSVFGPVAFDRQERALRFVEEAIELGHAIGLTRDDVDRLATRVFAAPGGAVDREIGQASATLSMLAANLGYSADAEAVREFERVKALPPEHWQKRHQAKVELGIAK